MNIKKISIVILFVALASFIIFVFIEKDEDVEEELVGCEEWLSHCAEEGEDVCGVCGCRECCEELDAIAYTYPVWSDEDDDFICRENMRSYICVNCGDGVCSEHENWCICPEDCSKPEFVN